MFLRVCALSLRDGRCQGLLAAQPAGVSLDVVCIPSAQRSEAQFLCACVCPNHSNSSTGLQQQQQQQCSFASVFASPGTAQRVNPALAVAVGRMFHSSSSNTVDTTLSGNMIFFAIILTTKLSLHFRRRWSNEEHRVRVFNAMLVLIFIRQ